jgi:hypothetical protein
LAFLATQYLHTCDNPLGARTGPPKNLAGARLLTESLHMRLFLPHFARPALLPNILRNTSTCTKLKEITRIRAPTFSRRLSCQQPSTYSVDEEDMGKDDKNSKNFNLKVPKGTRDCVCFSPIVLTAYKMYRLQLQGPVRMLLFAIAYSTRSQPSSSATVRRPSTRRYLSSRRS